MDWMIKTAENSLYIFIGSFQNANIAVWKVMIFVYSRTFGLEKIHQGVQSDGIPESGQHNRTG
jgi:hypothetical protein